MNHDLTERVVGDVLARLVSVPMPRSRGEAVLVILDADAETTGLFTIEMVNG